MAKDSTVDCHASPEEEGIFLHDFPVNAVQFEGSPSWSPADNAAAASTSQSHRQAEKRRRDRINGQLARLRKLIPMSDKMDKAALLESVVDQIRDMKKETSEISKLLSIPTETDDVTIECHANIQESCAVPNDKDNKNTVLIKTTICCEDRHDLIPDLERALKGLNLTVIEADVACLGGRIRIVLLLYHKDDGKGDNEEGGSNVSALKKSLMVVLTRLVSWSSTTTNFRVTSKRQRFFFQS